jgi:hypothetical protein
MHDVLVHLMPILAVLPSFELPTWHLSLLTYSMVTKDILVCLRRHGPKRSIYVPGLRLDFYSTPPPQLHFEHCQPLQMTHANSDLVYVPRRPKRDCVTYITVYSYVSRPDPSARLDLTNDQASVYCTNAGRCEHLKYGVTCQGSDKCDHPISQSPSLVWHVDDQKLEYQVDDHTVMTDFKPGKLRYAPSGSTDWGLSECHEGFSIKEDGTRERIELVLTHGSKTVDRTLYLKKGSEPETECNDERKASESTLRGRREGGSYGR